MQQNTLYKVLTYILSPFALLFAFFGLFVLLVGVGNPVLLLPACIMICFCIYTIATLIFSIKGISRQQQCKPSLKDWIKVNGYVSSAMAVMSLINSFTVIFTPKPQLIKLAGELLAAQATKPPGISVEAIASMIVALSYVMLIFSIILLIQLSISFKFLKKYAYLFGETPQ